ncbi:MAG: YiiX/YebB-like N1pC/P60 family cysteine hydrolase [Candidatus Omnitrophica bacterium]|nr:YiiX/YebB-like N1pC/P60 family cysteine hydrolase [Candidatus Omnitrophota bacterium]
MNNLKKYSKIRSRMQNGDVIAFQGTDFPAMAVQNTTGSQFSHVGLVIRITDVDIDRIFIIESVPSAGVVLLPLSRKLYTFPGRAWWAPLRFSKISNNMLPQLNEQKVRSIIYKWAMCELGKAYDFTMIGSIIKSILLKCKASEEDCREYICSELVAQAFKQGQIWPKGMNISNITPVDIINLPIIDALVELY